jgi:acyl carrier protein
MLLSSPHWLGGNATLKLREGHPMLRTEEITARIGDVLVAKLRISADSAVEVANIEVDLGATSLDMVETIMSLEDEFDVEISDRDAESSKTVGDVYRACEEEVLTARRPRDRRSSLPTFRQRLEQSIAVGDVPGVLGLQLPQEHLRRRASVAENLPAFSMRATAARCRLSSSDPGRSVLDAVEFPL